MYNLPNITLHLIFTLIQFKNIHGGTTIQLHLIT